MKIDARLQGRVASGFGIFTDDGANYAPEIGALSKALDRALSLHQKDASRKLASAEVAKMFTSASVNTWKRAVHSFLISSSLTDVSPIWASVSGYYSSHYTVRAIAHLLGFFQMYYRKRIVHLELDGVGYEYKFQNKKAGDREHRVYWRLVKADPHFVSDPFFTDNSSGQDECDGGHRDRANYHDHLPQFPIFRPLDASSVKTRIEKISEIAVAAPPIPRVSKYPDLEAVQIIAYHRLVRYRELVDAIVGDQNLFWAANRSPDWATEFIDFQVTEDDALRSAYTL